jgi:formate hydrogenlyase subunit 3/multisubunit Na+/H+ antiporter MnhD subunit
MIEMLIFHAHIVGVLYAFTKRWQEDNLREAFTTLGLVGLIFTIGWAITGTIAKLITPTGGFAPWFTADTLSLVLLIIPEVILFRIFFLRESSPSSPSSPSSSSSSPLS